MDEIDYFVPGAPTDDGGIVAGLRSPIPAGVTQAYVEALTAPGDLVLVPYCQGPAVVREIVAAGRRALAVHFDPALVLATRAALTPLVPRQLDAAVARLGDSLKQGVPLRQVLGGLYATTCPACLRSAVADYYVWDRDQEAPIAKHLTCPACLWEGQAAVDAEDRTVLAEVPARGVQYHYILDRVAPHGEEAATRARLESLLSLYSARNLYALAELTIKIEGLFPDGSVRQALNALLLDCLDRCSSLSSLPGGAARRRVLARPARFTERNVWLSFEEAVARLQQATGAPAHPLADSWETFWAAGGDPAQPAPAGGGALVGQYLVRDLARSLPPRSLGLILTSPPALDPAAWALSSLWGAWVLGPEAVAPLRPLLHQRSADPDWYAGVMAGALRKLSSLLRDDGRLILVLSGQRPAVAEALLLAASRARLALAGSGLVQCGADYRLNLRPAGAAGRPPQPGPAPATGGPVVPPGPALELKIRQEAEAAAAETIRLRGEPVSWPTLHAAVHRRLAELDLWASVPDGRGEGPSTLEWVGQQIAAAMDGPAFVRLAGGPGVPELWWLTVPGRLAPALSDRVEAAAHQVFAADEIRAWTEPEFERAVHARLPGPLTPEATLVAACLRDCGREVGDGRWQLREEDLPHVRQAERQAIIQQLLDLGQRLGYRAAAWAPFDVAWLEGARARALFVVRWQAAVSEALALGDRFPPGGARPYLVVPGGRAALISYKLAHNPGWQQMMEAAGWRFIKYRHVRELALQPEVDEYTLQTIIGLDPIVERESVQLALF